MLSALSALGLQPALQPDSLLESSNRSSAASADPPVPPFGQWTFHPGDLNCYDGHGAPGASSEAHAESISIEDCKAACVETSGCLAIVVEFEAPPEQRAWSNDVTCYLREVVWMEECVQGVKNYELHTFAPAPSSPPPSSPPFSISRLTAAGKINYRFRRGQPSDNLTEVGVIFRQFDGLEVHERPWEACEQDCHTMLFHDDTTNKSPGVPGRLSASISYRGLRERADRKGISLPYADRAGYVIRNEEISLQCLYGKDAATYNLESSVPGCNSEYCQPQNASSWQFFGGQPCGFSDYHPPAYSQSDMKIFLERYAQHGEAWKPPDFHSGYNEVIVSSSNMNKHLPRAVEAFFVLDESHADGDRTGNLGINVRQVRKEFIAKFKLEPSEVPLLLMDPYNWDEPFSVLDES